MKLIIKHKEPADLRNHRLKSGTDYESFCYEIGLGDIQPATGFRKLLLDEQGYLCAYCMRRIPHKHIEKYSEQEIEKDDMKVEHRVSQQDSESKAQKLDITHSNMFGCCTGGKGKTRKFQTCDTRKREDAIALDPTNEQHIKTINYGTDGEIVSTDADFDKDLNDTLNLNEKDLKLRREAIFQSVSKKTTRDLKTLMDRKAKNEYLNKQISWWLEPKDGKYKEYCMVAVVYLQNRLR